MKDNCIAVQHESKNGRIYVVSNITDEDLERLGYTILERGNCQQLNEKYERKCEESEEKR